MHKGERIEESNEDTTDQNVQEICKCVGDYFGKICQNDHKGNFVIKSIHNLLFS